MSLVVWSAVSLSAAAAAFAAWRHYQICHVQAAAAGFDNFYKGYVTILKTLCPQSGSSMRSLKHFT